MKKLKAIFIVTLVAMIISVGISGVNAKVSEYYKTRELAELEEAKNTFEKTRKRVPEDLLEKIEFEREYSKKVSEDLIRLEKEQQEKNNKIKEAKKDEKGKPIINDKKHSKDMKGELVKKKYLIKTESSPDFKNIPQLYSNYKLASQALINNVLVFSGNSIEDSRVGFIAYVCEDKTEERFVLKELKFEGAGTIYLEEIIEESAIIRFTYSDGKMGCFDANSLEAIFR